MSDDEDDEEEDYGKEEHEKEAIAEEIFQDGEGEEGVEAVDATIAPPEDEEEEEEDESGRHQWPIASNAFTPCPSGSCMFKALSLYSVWVEELIASSVRVNLLLRRLCTHLPKRVSCWGVTDLARL